MLPHQRKEYPREMDVYTLTGKSGTGKSFHAMNLCKKYNIESYTLLAGIPALVKAHGVWRNPKDDRIEYLNN